MISHYTIASNTSNVKFKASYKGGKFYKIEKLTGTLNENQIERLGNYIPPTENKMEEYALSFKDHLSYTKIENKTQTVYGKFVEEWYSFYDKECEMIPKFDTTDGAAIKKIITYLNKISADENEALLLWQNLLASWPKLPEFFRKSPDLKFIYSQINKIITHVKEINGHSATGQAHSKTGSNFKFGQ